jgi:hypothetical protein
MKVAPSAELETTCSVNVGWAEMIEKVIERVKKIYLFNISFSFVFVYFSSTISSYRDGMLCKTFMGCP